MGIWLEVTTLVIPGVNDDPGELRDIANFIAQEIGQDTPWHISRFFPTYKMTDHPPTPVATLGMARDIGLEEGLQYVYMGNVSGGGGNDTACPNCGQILIRRLGYTTIIGGLQEGRCQECGTSIAGVGMTGTGKK